MSGRAYWAAVRQGGGRRARVGAAKLSGEFGLMFGAASACMSAVGFIALRGFSAAGLALPLAMYFFAGPSGFGQWSVGKALWCLIGALDWAWCCKAGWALGYWSPTPSRPMAKALAWASGPVAIVSCIPENDWAMPSCKEDQSRESWTGLAIQTLGCWTGCVAAGFKAGKAMAPFGASFSVLGLAVFPPWLFLLAMAGIEAGLRRIHHWASKGGRSKLGRWLDGLASEGSEAFIGSERSQVDEAASPAPPGEGPKRL